MHSGRTVVRLADKHDDHRNNWIKELDQRGGKNISAVAVANKCSHCLGCIDQERGVQGSSLNVGIKLLNICR